MIIKHNKGPKYTADDLEKLLDQKLKHNIIYIMFINIMIYIYIMFT